MCSLSTCKFVFKQRGEWGHVVEGQLFRCDLMPDGSQRGRLLAWLRTRSLLRPSLEGGVVSTAGCFAFSVVRPTYDVR